MLGRGDNHQCQNFNAPIWELINTINTRTLTPNVTLYLENNPHSFKMKPSNTKMLHFPHIPPSIYKLVLLFAYILFNNVFIIISTMACGVWVIETVNAFSGGSKVSNCEANKLAGK